MTRTVNVLLAPPFPTEALRGAHVVAIDVLRATTTIATALANGADGVVPVLGSDDALAVARRLGRDRALLCGERDSVLIAGFDLDNSPASYRREAVEGKTLVLTTTNGTRLLVAAAERCEHVLVGSLLNLAAVAEAVRASGAEEAAVLCAGLHGELVLDDAYCAGRIAEALGGEPEDSAKAAILLARGFESHEAGLGASRSAGNLRREGLDDDIAWCARESALAVVPRLARMLGTAAEIVADGTVPA
jgi:2-phosphosulfolactate phosphatase